MAASPKMNVAQYRDFLEAGQSSVVELSEEPEERKADLELVENYAKACCRIYGGVDTEYDSTLQRLLILQRFLRREQLLDCLLFGASALLLNRKLHRTIFTPIFRPYHGTWRCPGLVVYLNGESLAPSMLMCVEYKGATWKSFRTEPLPIEIEGHKCAGLSVGLVTEGGCVCDLIFCFTEPDAAGIKDIMEVIDPQLGTASRLVRRKKSQSLYLTPEQHPRVVAQAAQHEQQPNARMPLLPRRYFDDVTECTHGSQNRSPKRLKFRGGTPLDTLALRLHPLVIVEDKPSDQEEKLLAIIEAPL